MCANSHLGFQGLSEGVGLWSMASSLQPQMLIYLLQIRRGREGRGRKRGSKGERERGRERERREREKD